MSNLLQIVWAGTDQLLGSAPVEAMREDPTVRLKRRAAYHDQQVRNQSGEILVELPGVSDVERAKQIIKSTAQVRLTLVDRGPFASRDAALVAYHDALPPDLEILAGKADRSDAANPPAYVVQRVPALTGNDSASKSVSSKTSWRRRLRRVTVRRQSVALARR